MPTPEDYVAWQVGSQPMRHMKPTRASLDFFVGGGTGFNLEATKSGDPADLPDFVINLENLPFGSAQSFTSCTEFTRPYGMATHPNPVWDARTASAGIEKFAYRMMTCDYVRRHAESPAGAITVNTVKRNIPDNPATGGIEVAETYAAGVFDFQVSDSVEADLPLNDYAIGDKNVKGNFQFKITTCYDLVSYPTGHPCN